MYVVSCSFITGALNHLSIPRKHANGNALCVPPAASDLFQAQNTQYFIAKHRNTSYSKHFDQYILGSYLERPLISESRWVSYLTQKWFSVQHSLEQTFLLSLRQTVVVYRKSIFHLRILDSVNFCRLYCIIRSISSSSKQWWCRSRGIIDICLLFLLSLYLQTVWLF